MKNTASHLMETIEIPDKSILDKITRYDAAETLDLPGKWPRSFATAMDSTPLINGKIPA